MDVLCHDKRRVSMYHVDPCGLHKPSCISNLATSGDRPMNKSNLKHYIVEPHARLKLARFDADDTGDYGRNDAGKAKAVADTAPILDRLRRLQERLYANADRAL